MVSSKERKSKRGRDEEKRSRVGLRVVVCREIV